jgi:hypothetical protein
LQNREKHQARECPVRRPVADLRSDAMAKTQGDRKKKEAKRLRNKYRRISREARKGMSGAQERREALDLRLKLLGIRTNV